MLWQDVRCYFNHFIIFTETYLYIFRNTEGGICNNEGHSQLVNFPFLQFYSHYFIDLLDNCEENIAY